MHLKKTTRDKGNVFEDAAVRFLQSKGYTIIDRNYISKRYGEIDIISEKNSIIVFVEVKGRKSLTYGTGDTSVTPQKKTKLIKSCEYWCIENQNTKDWQIDVVTIEEVENNSKKVLKLKHYPNCITQNDSK